MNTLRFVGWGVVLADFDGDGRTDLFQANGHVYPNVNDSDYAQPPVFLRNRPGGRFEPATEAWGPDLGAAAAGGRAVALGDLDGDGDLDLVVTTMDGPLLVLVNEGTPAHRAVRLRLIGRAPNREALGARVEVRAGAITQVGQVRRGGSFLAASDVSPHFGLGDARRVDRLSIRWPDGSTATYDDLPVDSTITVRQGESGVETTRFRRPVPTESAEKGRPAP